MPSTRWGLSSWRRCRACRMLHGKLPQVRSREKSPWPFKARLATASQGKPQPSRILVVTARGLVIKVTVAPWRA